MADNDGNTRAVMTRPKLDIHQALELIARHENRKNGPQATVFINEGVERYLEENPHIAEQLQTQA